MKVREILAPAAGKGSEYVIAVGASTGGPQALGRLLAGLPAALPAGVLVVQHMPPGFTASLAERLNQLTPLAVREAQEGDRVEDGLVLVAPGGRHLRIGRDGRVRLDDGPAVEYVRPSVDVLFASIAGVYGAKALGVILTGMGKDGARGAVALRAAGGRVIVQDEATATIFGMPRAALAAGGADLVLPLEQIATQLAAWLAELRSTGPS